MTWHGKRRWEAEAHPHESPPVMTWPMVILAVGSVAAGGLLIVNDRLQNFLAPVVGVPPVSHGFLGTAGIVATFDIGSLACSARVARRDDIDQLSAVFLDCWRISYDQVMPASLVARMTPEKARSLWADALQRPNQTILAATADEPPHPVVGFVGFQLQADGAGYVSSLYVSPHLQGGGVGRLLLSGAEQELRDAAPAPPDCGCSSRTRRRARSTSGRDGSPTAAGRRSPSGDSRSSA